MTKVLITICARGGSKGIPEKNIREINGLPLIAYSIKTAREYSEKYNCNVSLSTDNTKIRKIAEEYGLKTNYKRPYELSGSEVGKIEVLKSLLDYEEMKIDDEYDYLIDLDVTSPLRSLSDIAKAFEILMNSEAYNIFSVSKASRNPYFNMVERGNSQEYVKIVKTEGEFLTRQSAPKVYDMNASFYIYKRSFFNKQFTSSITSKSLAYEMDHICFDIDEPIDLLIMEFLISNRHLDFEL